MRTSFILLLLYPNKSNHQYPAQTDMSIAGLRILQYDPNPLEITQQSQFTPQCRACEKTVSLMYYCVKHSIIVSSEEHRPQKEREGMAHLTRVPIIKPSSKLPITKMNYFIPPTFLRSFNLSMTQKFSEWTLSKTTTGTIPYLDGFILERKIVYLVSFPAGFLFSSTRHLH